MSQFDARLSFGPEHKKLNDEVKPLSLRKLNMDEIVLSPEHQQARKFISQEFSSKNKAISYDIDVVIKENQLLKKKIEEFEQKCELKIESLNEMTLQFNKMTTTDFGMQTDFSSYKDKVDYTICDLVTNEVQYSDYYIEKHEFTGETNSAINTSYVEYNEQCEVEYKIKNDQINCGIIDFCRSMDFKTFTTTDTTNNHYITKEFMNDFPTKVVALQNEYTTLVSEIQNIPKLSNYAESIDFNIESKSDKTYGNYITKEYMDCNNTKLINNQNISNLVPNEFYEIPKHKKYDTYDVDSYKIKEGYTKDSKLLTKNAFTNDHYISKELMD